MEIVVACCIKTSLKQFSFDTDNEYGEDVSLLDVK